ncbi:MAG: shikimate kinase, partial [Candidatus Marinimicrobia bacterium]|nr:shikimate kinase [Candidatus Neomarinimicrobiota bacterium]
MGVGKSVTGKLLAERLNRQYVDTDNLIESRAGKPITKIFEQDG